MDDASLRVNLQTDEQRGDAGLQMDKDQGPLPDGYGRCQVCCWQEITAHKAISQPNLSIRRRLLQNLVSVRPINRSAEIPRVIQLLITRLSTGLHGPVNPELVQDGVLLGIRIGTPWFI